MRRARWLNWRLDVVTLLALLLLVLPYYHCYRTLAMQRDLHCSWPAPHHFPVCPQISLIVTTALTGTQALIITELKAGSWASTAGLNDLRSCRWTPHRAFGHAANAGSHTPVDKT